MRYSSAFRRFCAYLIDLAAIIASWMVFSLFLGISTIFARVIALPILGIWFFASMFCYTWLYFALLESSNWQATFGKKVLGLKVVDIHGERITFGRATGRYFSKLLSRLIFMIGFLMILFSKKKQGLHDKIAKTFVIE